ncbi:hypothetical protein FKM82_020659 [Ascaphus truei]
MSWLNWCTHVHILYSEVGCMYQGKRGEVVGQESCIKCFKENNIACNGTFCLDTYKADAVLLKASATLHSLTDPYSEETSKVNISSRLHLYTQAILDITFVEENRLVDEDFPDDYSLRKVKELIQVLSEPEVLVKETNLHQKPQKVTLDVDVLECLHWRRGALLYMYCHTVRGREDWLLRNRRTLQQCLKDGVNYLLKMLNSRSPVHLNDDVSFQDLSTAALLSTGIFSDIHVLALMYCGEMCYWGLKYCHEENKKGPPSAVGSNTESCDRSTFNMREFQETGEKVLEKYVCVCEGSLKGQGWNIENAKNILQCLKKKQNLTITV